MHEAGGISSGNVWIRKAFGDNAGFVAIWLEWMNNLISYPALLSFISVTLVYLFEPRLAQHKLLILAMTLCALWLMTGFTLRGIKASSRLSSVGVILGTILPALVIMLLAAAWIFSGKPMQIEFSWSHLLPAFKDSNPGFYAALILSFGGMQIIAFHTVNVRNPRITSYPRAIFSWR